MQKAGGATFVVTADEARNWIGRPVYSSDNKKIGEIIEITRDPSNKVTDVYVGPREANRIRRSDRDGDRAVVICYAAELP